MRADMPAVVRGSPTVSYHQLQPSHIAKCTGWCVARTGIAIVARLSEPMGVRPMTIMICDQLAAIPAETWATASMTAAVSSNAEHVMSLAYADEAVHIREVAPLTARDIARATGAGQSTVQAWLARTRAPSGRST
jgi:DNA-binding transcriptional regulator YiaG